MIARQVETTLQMMLHNPPPTPSQVEAMQKRALLQFIKGRKHSGIPKCSCGCGSPVSANTFFKFGHEPDMSKPPQEEMSVASNWPVEDRP